MTRPCPCSHHLATRLLNQARAWMPARTAPPAAGWMPAMSSFVMLPCTRAEAFPLGLGVLASKGVAAWRRTLASLAPVTPAAGPLPAGGAPALPAGLAAELISVLAAMALTGT